MEAVPLVFERELSLAPVIVWDALVDPELVSGWLASATITPEVGGEYNLLWMHRQGNPTSHGRIVQFEPQQLLVVDTSDAGLISFQLHASDSGERHTRLMLTVARDIEPVFAATVKADWLTALDQLDELLHGHPVDWATWGESHAPVWEQHRMASTA